MTKENDPLEYRNSALHPEFLERPTELLSELFNMTNPRDADHIKTKYGSAYLDAFNSYSLFGKETIKWAQNYMIGKILSSDCPLLHWKTSDVKVVGQHSPDKRPVYANDLREHFDPELEYIGACYDFSDVRLNREIMASTLRLLSNAFPGDLAVQLADSLEKLNHGEANQFVKPAKRELAAKRTHSYTDWRNRLRVVLVVEIMHDLGWSYEQAFIDVSERIGWATDTISSWRKKVLKTDKIPGLPIDKTRVNIDLGMAKRTAHKIKSDLDKNRVTKEEIEGWLWQQLAIISNDLVSDAREIRE